MKTQREKKLEIALLKEKIERISNKKVVFKENKNFWSSEEDIDMADAYNISYSESKKYSNALNKKQNIKTTPEDYLAWMTALGSGNYDVFDNAVKNFLGKQSYDYYDKEARLQDKLTYELGFYGDTNSGGIDLTLFTLKEDVSNSSKKYYAIFNILGEYNDGIPLYSITSTKKEMVNLLNNFIKRNLEPEVQFEYYEDEDLSEEARMYRGEKLKTYISDDWATVTDNEKYFKHLLNLTKNQISKPKLYKEGCLIESKKQQ